MGKEEELLEHWRELASEKQQKVEVQLLPEKLLQKKGDNQILINTRKQIEELQTQINRIRSQSSSGKSS
jgi:hypothetical protein